MNQIFHKLPILKRSELKLLIRESWTIPNDSGRFGRKYTPKNVEMYIKQLVELQKILMYI